MADPVPEQAGDNAGHEFKQPDTRAVPADRAGPQFVRHEIRRERLADGAKNSLVQAVENEEPRDDQDILRQSKAEIMVTLLRSTS